MLPIVKVLFLITDSIYVIDKSLFRLSILETVVELLNYPSFLITGSIYVIEKSLFRLSILETVVELLNYPS